LRILIIALAWISLAAFSIFDVSGTYAANDPPAIK